MEGWEDPKHWWGRVREMQRVPGSGGVPGAACSNQVEDEKDSERKDL